ncbi:MAG: BT_3928 family protein [Flavobacteriales bacterium]
MFKIIVQLSRILVGVLFIISGLIKSNDTLGFSYKLEEYYEVFGMEFLAPTALLQAMLICIVEVMLGVTLLLGYWKRLTLWLLMLMIVFFTFLTFYSAYFNKVTDCGCFGDAIKLTPWGSFTKDVVLLFFISILFLGQRFIQPIFSESVNKIIVGIALLLNIIFPVYTYNYLPVIDFRPYAPGKNIMEGMSIPADAPRGKYHVTLIYRNLQSGALKEFETDDPEWQDDTKWEWVETKSVEIEAPYVPPIKDFVISNTDGFEYTEDILNDENYYFFLVSYDLQKAKTGKQSKINAFAEAALRDGFNFYGLTSASAAAIDEFRHNVQATYDYYIMDGTTLKTMIRSNPGLMLIKKGTVIDMWHYNSFPDYEMVKNKYLKP